MANLRLVETKVIDSVTIHSRFTKSLDALINTSNVEVSSNLPNVPNPSVLKVVVSNDTLKITTQPMTPFAAYFVTFQNSFSATFKSKDGTAYLLEDGQTNVVMILGAEDPDNPVRKFLTYLLKDNVYSLEQGSLIKDVINSQANALTRALYDIRQVKNENYLSRTIYNERKIRSGGPYDRLNEENAYRVIRVGKQPVGGNLTTSYTYTSFPSGPISLLSKTINAETLTAGVGVSSFDNLILTVNYLPVIKLNSVTFYYGSGGSATYDISKYGYRINNSRYDEDYASTLLSLEDNQFQLSDQMITDGVIAPAVGDSIVVSYNFKALGRAVDEDTVTVTQVLDATREVTPPILTEFTLDHFPIVNDSDEIPTTGEVEFLDPEANPPFSTVHPAFTHELPFRWNGVPTSVGQYAVDYTTGRVFVYGAVTKDGTGDYPPVANYHYRNTFSSRLDYTYDSSTSDLAANPLRDLIDQEAKISFEYEENLIPDIDYIAQIHKEVIDERIENKLSATNCLRVNNSPITNVFRIYNESTGEIYTPSRWTDNSVYFKYIMTPNTDSVIGERVSFTDILNETLYANSELINTKGTRVFIIDLEYNRIFSTSEDVAGSSFNSSVSFSRTDIFDKELYFDWQILSVTDNINRLDVGQYQVDYRNGLVYVGVHHSQSKDIGSINYKNYIINPQHSHVISVSELYYSITAIAGISKRINYYSADEGQIIPSEFDIADERFTNGDITQPYIIDSGTITVTDDIKSVRGIFDVYDLNNNTDPINFAEGSICSANVITLGTDGIQQNVITTIGAGLIVSVPFVSAGIEIVGVDSVRRASDGYEYYNSFTTFLGYNIVLSPTSLATPGEIVYVIYSLGLNSAATPVVDYDRGGYYADYNYLVDEILVSYEYGDNLLDFRQSTAVNKNEIYYVTYVVGALRNALLQNFGTLVDLDILNEYDLTLPREQYRDALIGALQSFTKGPTIPAMTSLISSITHIDPEIIESAFHMWSLGNSMLYQNPIDYTEGIQLLPGKFDNGMLVSEDGDTVSFPVSSNLRLEEGTLETWVIPEWDGLDNDATLTCQLNKDGHVLPSTSVYIGASSFHPTYDSDNKFSINRKDSPSPIGLPSAIYTSIGAFIYYDDIVKRWKFYARDYVGYDGYSDGYVYSGTIDSSGEVYDVQWIPGLKEVDDVLRSDLNNIYFEFNLDGYDVLSPDGYDDTYNPIDGYQPGDGYVPGYSFDGITFMADDEHYIFDFGKTESTNRFSLYKDGRGYLKFRIFDNGNIITNRKNSLEVSTDISDWTAGQKHFIGLAWKLNTPERQDEMHLFIDGTEVPNLMRFGGRPIASSTDRFRTVKPEIVAGTVPKNVITFNDLHTITGSPLVFSDSIDFTVDGIVPGDTITILESSFTTYNILVVAGPALTLDSNMPATLEDARFSVNKYAVVVSSEINLSSNIAVSIVSGGIETEIPGTRAVIPGYSISKNLFHQDVLTLLGDAHAGDQIWIRTLGLNHRRCRARQYIWGSTSNVIKSQLPPPVYLDEAKIYAVPMSLTSIGPANAVLIGGRFFATGLTTSQPTNNTEGRSLSVRITGDNTDFTNPPIVQIVGVLPSGPGSETLTFTKAATKNTTHKFLTISSVNVQVTPFNTLKNGAAVEIKERYSITWSEGNINYPVIRFSYKTQMGTHLEGDGSDTVIDASGYFIDSNIGETMIISTPIAVAGSYTITGRTDTNTITVSPSPAVAFTGGTYNIYDVTIANSGFQNGFFTLELAGSANTAYLLNQGWYEFDYAAFLEIPFDPFSNTDAHVGSDMNNSKPAKAIIDEFRILSRQLTDTRVGESIATNEDSITTDYNSLRPFTKDSYTLMLLHFDSLPFINDSNTYITHSREYLQSSSSVNTNFNQSLIISDKPLIVDNKGTLTTNSEGTIEFWVSPRYDTYNDPNFRFYFDASGSIEENIISISTGSVKVSSSVNNVISVRLQTDTTNTGTDYYVGGHLDNDFRTITLGKALPAQETPVKVSYIPSGLSGDRISIYKDREGFITLNVRANETDYQVRHPIFWARDSWHRIRATFKFNRADNRDEIRLFIDSEERGTVLFGQGLIFGMGTIFGQGFAGVDNSILISDINFTDPINQFFIGSDYLKANPAQARIDNLRLSNLSRHPFVVAGQAKDVNYSTNTDIVYPVVEDLYTTYLLNFDTIKYKADDFTLLKDEKYGIFDFDINVIDSFNIISSNAKIKQVLENLISVLKPAQSKATVTYIE